MALIQIKLGGLAAESVDSDAYVDGSIDLAHLSADSVDSTQYVDASIDNAHLADDAADSDEIAAGAVDIAHLSASGTAGSGNFLRGDNSWNAPAAAAITAITGAAANQVLTDDGDGTVTSESGLTFDGNTLDISYGGTSSAHAIVGGANDGSTTRTNATTKYFQMGMANYENAEEQNGILYCSSGNTAANLSIGGAGGGQNGFTSLKFYTGTDPQSTTVKEKFNIDSAGVFSFMTGSQSTGVIIRGRQDGTEGFVGISDDATVTFEIPTNAGDGGSCLLLINETNEGAGLIAGCCRAVDTIPEISDPHGAWNTTDTDGNSCVFKSNADATVTIKNRNGSDREYSWTIIAY